MATASTATTVTTTPCKRLNAMLDRARAAGLAVEIIDEGEEYYSEMYSVTVRRPHVEAKNALDVVRNHESIHILASRSRGRAVAFRLNARFSGYGGGRELSAATLPYALRGLEDAS